MRRPPAEKTENHVIKWSQKRRLLVNMACQTRFCDDRDAWSTVLFGVQHFLYISQHGAKKCLKLRAALSSRDHMPWKWKVEENRIGFTIKFAAKTIFDNISMTNCHHITQAMVAEFSLR